MVGMHHMMAVSHSGGCYLVGVSHDDVESHGDSMSQCGGASYDGVSHGCGAAHSSLSHGGCI